MLLTVSLTSYRLGWLATIEEPFELGLASLSHAASTCSAVLPARQSLISVLALASNSRSITFLWLFLQAKWSGV
jgi:hypothetical protein